MTIIHVFHNEGPGRFHDFDPATAILSDIGTYDVPYAPDADNDDADLIEQVWEDFNVGDETTPHIAEYRARRARSLSVGDVIVIDLGDTARVYAVAGAGFDPIDPVRLGVVPAVMKADDDPDARRVACAAAMGEWADANPDHNMATWARKVAEQYATA